MSVQLRQWRAAPSNRQATKEDLLDVCDVLARLSTGLIVHYSKESIPELRSELRRLLQNVEKKLEALQAAAEKSR